MTAGSSARWPERDDLQPAAGAQPEERRAIAGRAPAARRELRLEALRLGVPRLGAGHPLVADPKRNPNGTRGFAPCVPTEARPRRAQAIKSFHTVWEGSGLISCGTRDSERGKRARLLPSSATGQSAG